MEKLKLNIQKFSSTNKTTNLELSQYIANDKPTYLVDYNGDMLKIDTAVHSNTTKSLQNETNIGTMSNLDTTEKSSLVGAINEINTQVGTNTGNITSLNTQTSANTGNIGTMANLDTTDKTSLVNALNEVNTTTTSNTSIINDIKGTLLWTNESPNNDFAGQTLNINLSNYDIIDIVSNTGVYRSSTTGYTINMIRMQDSNGDYSGSWFIDMRRVQVNPTEIVFQDNKGATTNSTNSYTTRNSQNKPLYIIGYKLHLS